MIRRGSHVILDDIELMQRVRRPDTVKLLKRMMWFYEMWACKQAQMESNCVMHPSRLLYEKAEFNQLMKDVGRWLTPPLRLDFYGTNHQRRDVDGDNLDRVRAVNLSKAARRRRRRQERKSGVDGVCGSP